MLTTIWEQGIEYYGRAMDFVYSHWVQFAACAWALLAIIVALAVAE